MVEASPFKALRYEPAVVGDLAEVSAPAYDELERFTYAAHRTGSPYTVLELFAPDHAEAGDPYAHTGATLQRWLRTGVLRTDQEASFFRYEEHELRGGVPHVLQGVLAAVALEPLDGTGSVLPHEQVEPGRVLSRLERLRSAPVDLSPVLAFYTDGPAPLRELLSQPPATPPVVAISDEHGTDHRIWRLEPSVGEQLPGLFRQVRVVLADGHHRYAAAQRFRTERDVQDDVGNDAPWQRILMYLVEAEGSALQVLPMHRLLTSLPTAFRDDLDTIFHVEETTAHAPELLQMVAEHKGICFGLRTADGGALLRPRDEAALRSLLPADRPAGWRELDVALLDHGVLPALGVGTGMVDRDHDVTAAAERVDRGELPALVLVRPVTAETVHTLATAGEIMPSKSTYFRPKPRTGLLMRSVTDR